MNRFFIISTGWNCPQYVEKCIKSIRAQTYNNHVTWCVADGCERTYLEVERVGKVRLLGNYNEEGAHTNYGAAYSRDRVMKYAKPDDIVVFLGMDDELLPNALERINEEYEAGKLMTYGNWINQDGHGLPESFELDFSDEVHADRSYRKVRYRSTAPNTFRRFLYDCIKPEDLKLNGEWYKATTESEVMFSCLEQCGKDRIGVIKEPIYLYNQNREQMARHRFGVQYQERIYSHVVSKTKRPLWNEQKG